MHGADFILAINLVVAGLIAVSFMAVAVHDRPRAAARWIALAYFVGMANPLLEFAIASFGNHAWRIVLSFAVILAAMAILNVGIARKYEVAVPWLSMGLLFAGSVAACYLILDMPRQSFTRMMIYQAPYFAMQAIGVGIIGQTKSRRLVDNVLMAILSGSALQFLSKPFFSQITGGTGASPKDYLNTGYAMVSQSLGTVFAIAVALGLLVVLVRDALSDATERSHTDMLSGLLNRGGFEARAAHAIQEAERVGLPVSLVISDLDHFKSVNDTYGHACGDRVIVEFATFLRSAVAEHHLAGRIGGEEFAVLLPATNLVAARLFAEGARSTFATTAIEGLPAKKRVTASFGVAESTPGETITDLLRRADKALYLAKESGRDCVKIAPRPDHRSKVDGPGAAVSV